MCGLERARQWRGREERTQECVCFGIQASTGETPQMGDTLDILFCFTTHCLFTSRYVQCVYICAISAFLGVLVSAYYVCSVLYDLCQHCMCIHVCLCVSLSTCMCVSS